MKSKLYKTEELVKEVLIKYKDSRSDDFVLIYRVYQSIDENAVIREPFYKIMLNHKEYRLPAIASVMRARRKVYEKYPYLKPKRVSKLRKDKEEEYKEYSRS